MIVVSIYTSSQRRHQLIQFHLPSKVKINKRTRHCPADSRYFSLKRKLKHRPHVSTLGFLFDLKSKNCLYFLYSNHIQGMYKGLNPSFLTWAVRHAFYAIRSSTYRSHSPVASDICHFESSEARKVIIGKGLKCKHASQLPLCASASY